MNKPVFCFALSLLAPLCMAAGAPAETIELAPLFSERGTDALTFYQCTVDSDIAEESCRSVNREQSVTFCRDGTASGNYFGRKKVFTGTWEQNPWGIRVKESSSISMPFTLETLNGKTYLIYHHEQVENCISPLILE